MPLFLIAICSSFLLVFVRIVLRLIHIRRFSLQHGCREPARIAQSERILGLGLLQEQLKSVRSGTFLQMVMDRFHQHGNTYVGSMMGMDQTVTCEPENFKAVLSTHFQDWGLGARRAAFKPMLGESIFTLDGSGWQHSREILRPSFSREYIADLANLETHVQRFISCLPHDPTISVNLEPLIYKFTMDVSTEFLFGESLDLLRGEQSQAANYFGQSFDAALLFCQKRIRLGWFCKFHYSSDFQKHCRIVRRYVDNYVQKALQYKDQSGSSNAIDNTSKRRLLLSELVQADDNPDQIRDAILSLLLAGRDTTSNLLSTTLFLLARHTDIWQKLQTEVRSLNGQLPDYASIKEMTYLRYVLQEALRLYPVAPHIGRVAIRDTTLPRGGGPDGLSPVLIEKGHGVLLSMYGMHRRQDIFGPDAEDFRPERWETLRHSWSYLPFSGGPRVCLGQQFAQIEASYLLIRLLQTFSRLESRDEREFMHKTLLTLGPANGVIVGFERY